VIGDLTINRWRSARGTKVANFSSINPRNQQVSVSDINTTRNISGRSPVIALAKSDNRAICGEHHWLSLLGSTRAGTTLRALLLDQGHNAMNTGDNSPRTADYYLERAAECERLAGGATTEENRKLLLMLAERWRVLAAEQKGSPPETG
jgi:hypothetical protein